MKKYLFINTVNKNIPTFAIFTEDCKILGKSIFYNKLEKLVFGLEAFLKKQKTISKDVRGVIVITGPGSFTSLRAGVALANSFNMLFKIPVLGIKDIYSKLDNAILDNFKKILNIKEDIKASVYYNKEPNITLKI